MNAHRNLASRSRIYNDGLVLDQKRDKRRPKGPRLIPELLNPAIISEHIAC